MKYPEAVEQYTEALRRNPSDARVYSNRAACYTKLGALPDALKDADKAIDLDPSFVKGYTRKGAAHFLMKEYEKAMKAYEGGLAVEADNEECKNGIQVRAGGRGEGRTGAAALFLEAPRKSASCRSVRPTCLPHSFLVPPFPARTPPQRCIEGLNRAARGDVPQEEADLRRQKAMQV